MPLDLSEQPASIEALNPFTIGDEDPLTDARRLRDFMFSQMPIGSSITAPYWFSPETKFGDFIWHEEIQRQDKPTMRRTINFDIQLYDGSNLTDKKNASLRDSFSYLLAYQIHPRYRGGKTLSPDYAHAELTKSLQICDYIILNGEKFKICEHGFSLITENHIIGFLNGITELPTSEVVYDFPRRLVEWFEPRIATISAQDIEAAIRTNPQALVSEDEVRTLELTDDQLLKARVFLLKNSLYDSEHGELIFRLGAAVADIYKNTLNGLFIKPLRFEELDLGDPLEKGEYPPVEIRRKQTEGASHKVLDQYIETFQRIAIIKECETGINKTMLSEITKSRVVASKSFASPGRYLTAPISTVLGLLRSSIEFVYENADWILDSMFAVIEAKHERAFIPDGNNSFQVFAMKHMPQVALDHGVTQWSMKKNTPEFYDRMRANASLCDLYKVLLGSIQSVTGVLCPRRKDELYLLDSDECVFPKGDPNDRANVGEQYYVSFRIKKTGAAGEQDFSRRPIPTIVAKFLRKLSAFNDRLAAIGVMPPGGRLFRNISSLNASVTDCSQSMYYNNFNKACDYFELPTIEIMGIVRRYYIRQHQLRRFFAIAFFWGTNHPDLETLTYMLGHTDAHMFYRYVTDQIPGRILREAKASRIQTGLENEDTEIRGMELLVDKLRKNYNAKQIHIRTMAELAPPTKDLHDLGLIETMPSFDEYLKSQSFEFEIDDYLRDGEISLEPEFFEVTLPDGQIVTRYHLVLLVKDVA